MPWMLHTRFRDYVVLDHVDLRDHKTARRRTPILGGGGSTIPAETVEEPPPAPVSEVVTETHWIEIEMVGEDDKPIPGVRYEVKQSDGTAVLSGRLDRLGFIRATVPESGSYLISFPELDKEAWESVA